MIGNISKQSMKFLSEEFMAMLWEYHLVDPVEADKICVEMSEDFKRMDVGVMPRSVVKNRYGDDYALD